MSAADLASPGTLAVDIADTGDLLVMLDFDGTLSPIVDDPEAASPTDGAIAAVRRLAQLVPVALVSGRPVDDLLRRVPDDLLVTLAGGHGAELRTSMGDRDTLVDLDAITPTLDALEADLGELVDVTLGWYVERKPTGIAVHHRRVSGPVEPTLTSVRERMRRTTAVPPGFGFVDGKAVTELRVAGIDKGGVVRRLAAETPDRLPVFVGDDVTDEDAFEACNELGGCTVLVAPEPRRTAATWRLRGPQEVVVLIERLADLLAREPR